MPSGDLHFFGGAPAYIAVFARQVAFIRHSSALGMKLQARYEDLAVRSTEGQLSEAEQKELGSIVRANGLLSVLQAEARAFLENSNAR